MNKPLRILSLGAGVQSTTLLLMMLHNEIERADHVIFADTGWEPAAVYQHLAHLETLMTTTDMTFHRVSVGNIRHDSLQPNTRSAALPFHMKNKDGTNGMIRRQCTNHYKIEPLLKKERELVGLKPGQRAKGHLATTIIGISWDETQRMRDAKYPWLRNEYPLVDRQITRQDCLDWCAQHGYALPPRSACVGCPFKTNKEWRLLRDTMPSEWLDAVDFDKAIRAPETRKAAIRSTPFLHTARVPLDEVDLRTDAEKGILTLFADEFGQECEGMCGL